MTLLYILLILVLLGVVFVGWQQMKGGSTESPEQKMMLNTLNDLRRDIGDTKDKLNQSLATNTQNIQSTLDNRVMDINKRLDSAAMLMGQVQKQYGKVEELSGDIKRLQEAFKSPKPRGSFGERALVDLASQVLPTQSFEAQHSYRNGTIVDLMIKTSNGNISIDAKFPLENYMRLVDKPDSEELRKLFRNDVKKHIKDVSKKYILPDEGTVDFALIYVPSDAVMYEILTDGELSTTAEDAHVFILSPHSFYYFLNIIRLAYQSQKFEENAKQVLALIQGIQSQNGKLGEELTVLQKHLGNASSKMGNVFSEYSRLDMQISQAARLDALPADSKKSLLKPPTIIQKDQSMLSE